MSYGTTTSPVLYIYDVETLSNQLDERTRAYLIKHVTVSSDEVNRANNYEFLNAKLETEIETKTNSLFFQKC